MPCEYCDELDGSDQFWNGDSKSETHVFHSLKHHGCGRARANSFGSDSDAKTVARDAGE